MVVGERKSMEPSTELVTLLASSLSSLISDNLADRSVGVPHRSLSI